MIRYENNDILNEYFDWMYHLVCNDRYYNKVSYKKLFLYLFSKEYIPELEMDDNRRVDGLYFRYRFGFDRDINSDDIREYIDYRNCSVLEMMIALAFKVEETITSDPLYGDRTGQWFWSMVVNLGLGNMNDSNFDQNYCEDILETFLRHRYDRYGHGGLFVINNPKEDLRNVDIWCQFMWYLNETIYKDN